MTVLVVKYFTCLKHARHWTDSEFAWTLSCFNEIRRVSIKENTKFKLKPFKLFARRKWTKFPSKPVYGNISYHSILLHHQLFGGFQRGIIEQFFDIKARAVRHRIRTRIRTLDPDYFQNSMSHSLSKDRSVIKLSWKFDHSHRRYKPVSYTHLTLPTIYSV